MRMVNSDGTVFDSEAITYVNGAVAALRFERVRKMLRDAAAGGETDLAAPRRGGRRPA